MRSVIAFIRHLHGPLRWLFMSAMVLTLTSLLLLLLAQQLWIRLDRYQQTIEQRISQVVGAPVRIERLVGTWQGIEPDFRVYGLRIFNPKAPSQPLLYISYIKLEPALLASLWHRDLRLHARIDLLNLHLSQQENGTWQVDELAPLGQSSTESRQKLIQWVLQQAAWQLNDASLTLKPWHKPELVWQFSGHNRNLGPYHQLRIQGVINQQPMQWAADLHTSEPAWQRQAWSGKTYLQVPALEWQPWLDTSFIPDLQLQRVQVGLKAWLSIEHGQPQQATLVTQIPHAQLSYHQQPIYLQQLENHLFAQRQAQGWQITVQPQQGEVNQVALPLKLLQLQQQGSQWHVFVHDVDVADALSLARLAPLPVAVDQWLKQATPQGHLNTLAFSVKPTENSWQLTGLEADIRQLAIAATSDYSGVKGLQGWLSFKGTQLYAQLQIKQGLLDLRQVFHHPVLLDSLTVNVRGQQDTQGNWLIQTDKVQLQNPDTKGEALVSLWIPQGKPAETQMQLWASIRDAKVTSAWRYVPWPSAGEETLTWLRTALVSGDLKQGDFLYQGVLIDRPDLPHSVMQMRFMVDDVTLAYAPKWPALQHLSGVVTIDNHNLTVEARHAQLYDSVARHVVADIPDLADPKLVVNADLESTGDDVLRLFRESPLHAQVGRMPEVLAVKGELTGHLNLMVPLANTDATQISVSADLPGNTVVLQEANIFDLWLSGHLDYQSKTGLSSPPLQGFFLAQPINIQFRSIREQDELAAIQVTANGTWIPASLKPWLGHLTNHMHGSTHYQASLTIPIANDPVQLIIDSDLAGWQMDFPAPLGKKAEPLPLHYEMLLGTSEQQAYLGLNNHIQSRFTLKQGAHIDKMLVHFGEGKMGELATGLTLTGALPSVNVDEWRTWLSSAEKNTVPSTATEPSVPNLQAFDVAVENLDIAGYRLAQVHAAGQLATNVWQVQVQSPKLKGQAKIPLNYQEGASVNLQQLTLPFNSSPLTNVTASNTTNLNLSSWPTTDIKIEQLLINTWPDLPPSSLQARLQPMGQGLRVQNLSINNPVVSINGLLDWQWRGKEQTSFSGELHTLNIANLFSAFASPPVLNSQNANAQISLVWNGKPSDLALSTLGGQMRIQLNKGRFLNLNRMASVSRLLGLLDSDNFKRRLQLDFSDITQKGLAYDRIEFTGQLEEGDMASNLVLQSPSLSLQGRGQINLATEQVKQQLDIALPVTSAVPLAAVVVAGPLVGGALAAAETVFDNSLKKVTTLHYSIQGDWHNPRIERVKRPLLPWRNLLKHTQPVTE